MYSKKEVVYKLHAGWFINRTPGKFINWFFLLNLKVLSVEILQKRGKFATKFLAARQFMSPIQAPCFVLVCRKQGASGQEKVQYIKYLHCQRKPQEILKRIFILGLKSPSFEGQLWGASQKRHFHRKGALFVEMTHDNEQEMKLTGAKIWTRFDLFELSLHLSMRRLWHNDS